MIQEMDEGWSVSTISRFFVWNQVTILQKVFNYDYSKILVANSEPDPTDPAPLPDPSDPVAPEPYPYYYDDYYYDEYISFD